MWNKIISHNYPIKGFSEQKTIIQIINNALFIMKYGIFHVITKKFLTNNLLSKKEIEGMTSDGSRGGMGDTSPLSTGQKKK